MDVQPYDRGLIEVAPSTYAYLQPDGGWGWSNAGLVAADDGCVLVDTFFDLSKTRDLLAAVRGATDRPIRTLVNTHHNGDHVWGNQLVEGATIVGHSFCREEMIRTGTPQMFSVLESVPDDAPGAAGYLKRAFTPFDFSGIEVTPPTITFEDSMTVFAGDRRIELRHFGPCHTLGDVAAWVPDTRTLFAGDLLFYGSTPLVWEGSLRNWIATLDKLIALDPVVVIPGHGPATDAGGLRAMQGYLRLVVEQGAHLMKERGLSPLEAAREMDLGVYADWKDSERLVINFMRLDLELDDVPAETRIDTMETFENVAALAAS